jgi:hypothetical protein
MDGRVIELSTGDMYNAPRKLTLNDPKEGFALVCDQAVAEPVFVDSKFVEGSKWHSDRLSNFKHKPEYIRAAVILPAKYYTESKRRFPLYFMVAGFGDGYNHYSKAASSDTLASVPLDTIASIKVYLDGDCSFGHSAYANSDNNGPVVIDQIVFIISRHNIYSCLLRHDPGQSNICLWRYRHLRSVSSFLVHGYLQVAD